MAHRATNTAAEFPPIRCVAFRTSPPERGSSMLRNSPGCLTQRLRLTRTNVVWRLEWSTFFLVHFVIETFFSFKSPQFPDLYFRLVTGHRQTSGGHFISSPTRQPTTTDHERLCSRRCHRRIAFRRCRVRYTSVRRELKVPKMRQILYGGFIDAVSAVSLRGTLPVQYGQSCQVT